MKNLAKLTLVAALFLMCSSATFAQKFGYINSQELIAAMPERDSVANKMQKFQEELQTQFEAIQVEFNNKFQDYQKNAATYTESVNQMKAKELEDLRNRSEEFQQQAQQDMQNMYTQLMAPVITKAQEGIKKVSKAGGFTIVFDAAAGALAYQDDATVANILPLVKKELGIVDKPATTPAAK